MHRLNRIASALMLAACATVGQAQTAAPLQPLPNTPDTPVVTRSGFRPQAELPSARFGQALDAANARALADLAALRTAPVPPIGAASTPANCDRRVLRVGLQGDGNFSLRPGQHLVLSGCFGDAPPGQVRMNGSFPGGYVTLSVQSWSGNHVHAKVPEVTGVWDQPIRVQLKFGDGDFSNELNGQFHARRGLYEVSHTNFVDFIPKTNLPVCSWESCTFQTPKPGHITVRATQAAQGTHGFKGRQAQHHLVGYYIELPEGTSQFSHWGADGELNVDWATQLKALPGQTPWHRSTIHFTKWVIDAPLGTVPGGTLRPHTINPDVATKLGG